MRFAIALLLIIFTVLPVKAASVEELYKDCLIWKSISFTDSIGTEGDRWQAIRCTAFLASIRDFGMQNCALDVPHRLKFDASITQLAQSFINFAEAYPAGWAFIPYGHIAVESQNSWDLWQEFPCQR